MAVVLSKTCQCLIKEKMPSDPHRDLLDLLTYSTTSLKSTTKDQKKLLKQLIALVTATPLTECDHNNLGIAAFLHGGGFLPIYASPEIICLDCGLNVTVYNPKDYKRFSKEFGLGGGKAIFKDLQEWAIAGMKSKKLTWVDDVQNDPIGEYNKCKHKWTKNIPIKILNKKVFESKSGQEI